MKHDTAGRWTGLRWLAAIVLALGPALVFIPATQAAPARIGRLAPALRPRADSPQPGPSFTPTTFTDGTDGACSVDHCTLREAVIAANALAGADAITLLAGTYVLDLVGADEDAAATGDLDLTGDLTLTGVTSATTIISGTAAAFGDRLFEITSTVQVTMSNIGLTGGDVSGGGGGLLNAGVLTFSDSRIFGNYAGTNGGGLAATGSIHITATEFTGNEAGEQGGGLYAFGPATVVSSTFTGNAAQNGGGLFGAGLTLTDSVIAANTAITHGGGLYGLGFVTLSGGQVSSNTAGDEGGGLYLIAEATLSGTQVVSNTSQEGGGIRNMYALTMTAGAVLSNTAVLGGGISNHYWLAVTGTLIARNSASLLGGGLYNVHLNQYHPAPQDIVSQATIHAASFISNTSDFGGGLFNSGNLTMTGSLFEGNTAPKTYLGWGGGLANASSPQDQLPFTALISGTVFQHNSAFIGGGVVNYDRPMELINTDFISNTGAASGGGLLNGDFQLNPTFSPTAVLTITGGLFEDNYSLAGGGVLNAYNSRLYMAQSTVISNSGVASGLYNVGELTLVASNVTANASTGLANEISGTVTISTSLFERNQGSALWNAGTLTLTNSLVLSNTITGSGGGLHATGPTWVVDSAFAGNTASAEGGGVLASGPLTLTNVTLSGNQAGSDGGGLAALNQFATQANVHLNNVTIANNSTTSGDGGGVYTMLPATVRLTNTLIAGNLDSGGQAPDCAGPLTSGGYNLIGTTTGCTLGGDPTGVVTNTAALLGPLADNGGDTLTHALLAGSPAVNAGNPAAPGSSLSACATTDQRGVTRPFGPRCDLGAYETTEAVLTAQMGSTNYSASESAGSAPFTVTLSAASAFTVTVVYSTTLGGTATPGVDFVSATGTVTFTPGLTATQSAITLLPDLLDETDETIFVVLTSTVNATLTSPTFTRLSLLDDDASPAVQWQTAAYTTTESAATALLTATLSAPSGLTVTVSYTPTNGSATAGADYVAATGVLTFAPGLTTTQAAVTLLPDLADEPDETFTVTLGSPANATLGAPSAATVNLLDDDAPPTAQLSAALYGALESATTLPFTATLSAPSGLTVTVTYSTTGGTATPGADYVAATGVLTFAPGLTTTQAAVALLPDAAYEPAETFGLELSAPSNAVLGAPSTATVIIADDDTPPTVQLTAAAYVAGEADPTVPFTVTLSAASGLTITVAYTTSDTSPTPGSATAGADYVAATGVLTFAPGLTTTQGALTLLPDNLYEPAAETFALALGAPSNATLGVPSAATLSLVEDDGPPNAQFSAANYSAGEGSPTAPFTVTLSGPASLTVTVTYSTTAGGSAAPGADYLAATGVLTFAPGLTTTQGALTLLPDALDEADETIMLAITSTTIATLGALDTTRLTIVDDDAPPTVQWSAAAYPTTEGAGSVTLTATLSAPSALTVTVAYTSAPGTAAPGSDYTPAAGLLTFTPGQTTQTVILTLLADAAVEPAETLTLTLGSPVNATLGAPAAAGVTIADDDGYALYLPLVIRPAAAAQGYHVGRMSK